MVTAQSTKPFTDTEGALLVLLKRIHIWVGAFKSFF